MDGSLDGKKVNKENVMRKSVVREYAEAFVIALLLALFFRTFVAQAFKIPSGSMIDTLLIGDHILVNKFIFGPRIDIASLLNKRLFAIARPKRGDVVVFLEPQDRQKDFIKRVIGLPGETIQIVDRQVFVDGKPLDESKYAYYESYRYVPDLDNFGPVTIPEDSYFVMGDNRENSADSRKWGFVPFSLIKGKAFVIYWSWDGMRHRVRWGRLGDIIH